MEKKKIGVLTFQKVAKTDNIAKKYSGAENFAMKHHEQVKLYLPFLYGKNQFSPRNFSEKKIVLKRGFFVMSEKFHACFARNKWLLFMVKKKIWEI